MQRNENSKAILVNLPVLLVLSVLPLWGVDRTRNLIGVVENAADQIARFDPRTKTFVEYPMPGRFASVRRIEADPTRPNRVWYSGQSTDKVGYLDVLE
ncbi:MAG: hypothetical protein A3J28_15935 [Acidobacteria bacterium RIFCSPLOWO2_12_FULL_60_22]|nr:MAG: hypothetical protein A3J28_15935 [Acidobacteria bacterium RIFCSPLOWO2_12_FULL_60_22]